MNQEQVQAFQSPETDVCDSIEAIEFELLELRQLILTLAHRSDDLQPLPASGRQSLS